MILKPGRGIGAKDLDAVGDLDSNLTARVVIDGWDKLIARPGGNELYDLKNDPRELTNLIKNREHAKIVAQMKKRLATRKGEAASRRQIVD